MESMVINNSLELAVNAMRQGQHYQAEAICREHLQEEPSSVHHHRILSHALIKTQRLDEAVKALEFALSFAPDFAGFHEDMGSALAILERYQDAKLAFERALEIDPTLVSARKKLAKVLIELGLNMEADEVFRERLDRDDASREVTIGAEHWQAGRYSEAQKVLTAAVRKYPENVDAMRFLALVYHDQGIRMLDAEALLRRAVEMAPDYVQALHNLGVICRDNNKWQDAYDCYAKITKLSADDPMAWLGRGNSASHMGNVDESVSCYQRATDLDAGNASAWMVLGHALKTQGSQGAALDAYRQALAIDDRLGEVYWSMANLKIFNFNAVEIAAMQKHIENENLKEVTRANMYFALGKAYEDMHEYAKAWEHYTQGNALNRTLVDYDPVDNELVNQSQKEVFTKEFVDSHRGQGCQSPDPIFIVGLPRTGSTLIEQILASHSKVEGTAELPNINAIAMGTMKYRADRLKYPQTAQTFKGKDWESFGKEYLKQVAHHRVEGCEYFIDKLPNNFVHIGWIKLTMPNAKIINTRRFPVDSCLGVYKQLFASGQNFSYDQFELAEYYRGYIDLMDHWHSVFPGEILDVHYEQTVNDLEGQVRRILDFCGLEFEPSCLNFHENKRAVKTASSEQVRQPIYRSALSLSQKYGEVLDYWRDELQDICDALPEDVKTVVKT